MSKRVTKAELEEFYRLDEERKSLNRQAKDKQKLMDELEAKFTADVHANGGPEKTVMRCGYRLSLAVKSKAVEWAKEFLRVVGGLMGTDKATAEAERIRAASPKTEVLTIETPAELASVGR